MLLTKSIFPFLFAVAGYSKSYMRFRISAPWLISFASFKLHGSARPISMKSDVIRKRSRHDARRGSSGSAGNLSGHSSETPSASPGASRRPSPLGDADGGVSPTLGVDSNPCAFDDIDAEFASNHMTNSGRFGYGTATQSELVGALGGTNAYSYPALNLSSFPGSYHHDLSSQLYSADYTTSSGDTSDCENGIEMRVAKRRRMSDGSATEPPSSAVSFSSFGDGSSFSASSATSAGSARHSMEFSFSGSSSSPSNGCGSPNMNGGSCNASNGNCNSGASGYYSSFWHPPMLPQPRGSPFIHPPMLLPVSANESDVQMDFLHGPTGINEGDHFLNPYIHPPMLLPEPHPPMLPSDWSGYPTDGVGGGANGY
jgi:GATA-binding protein